MRRVGLTAATASLGLAAVAAGAALPAPEERVAPAPVTLDTQLAAASTGVHQWVTTTDGRKLLARLADTSFGTTANSSATRVVVDDSQRAQRFRGVGASLTESSAVLLDRLSPTARDTALRSLFSATGAGLSFLRQPLGASDFALSDYTLDDSATPDPSLARFSTARDEAHVLPLLRRAKALNPSLSVMLTPWSAPAWMKASGTLHGGELAPAHEQDYARYLARSVQAYRAAGVPVTSLTIANEPLFSTGAYPSMSVPEPTAARILGTYLPSALAAAGQQVDVFGYDHNWDDTSYPSALLDDPVVAPHLAGTAFHCYAGDVSAEARVQQAHPDKEVLTSECSGGSWSTDFGQNLRWDTHNLLIGGLRAGSTGLALWNLALDPTGGPTNGGCGGCRGVVTIDPVKGTVTRNVEYYVLGHVGRFVVPGAVRVGSTSEGAGGLETVAFRNPDGSHVLLLHADGSVARTAAVAYAGRTATVNVPAGGLVTVTW